MIGLLLVLVGTALITFVLWVRSGGRNAPEPESGDPVALFIRFVRTSGEPKLAVLPELELLRLGMATCESLREYDGDVDMTLLAAMSMGTDLDLVLPIVVGAGFFLCPEYKEDVRQAGLTSVGRFHY